MVAAPHAAGMSCIVKGFCEGCSPGVSSSAGDSGTVVVGGLVEVEGGSCPLSIVGELSQGEVVGEWVVVNGSGEISEGCFVVAFDEFVCEVSIGENGGGVS